MKNEKVKAKFLKPVEYPDEGCTGYVRIEFRRDEELSLVGEVLNKRGKMVNGGQCLEKIREGTPAYGWTQEMVDRLCEIWDKWHLNTMRPYCKHQKELGWAEKAHEKVILYTYSLKTDVYWKIDRIKKQLVKLAKDGIEVVLNEKDKKLLNLKYEIVTTEKLSGEMLDYYDPKKPFYSGDKGFKTIEELGWLRETEHPDGLLGKKCPVCGHVYGGAWQKEEVPRDVLDWLFALPDAKTYSELWQ